MTDEPTKVFTVIGRSPYEKDRLLGIFSTEERAEAYVQKYQRMADASFVTGSVVRFNAYEVQQETLDFEWLPKQ